MCSWIRSCPASVARRATRPALACRSARPVIRRWRKSMKTVVTGVAGFIGSHLAEKLLGGNHQVIGVDKFLDNYPRELKERNLSGLKEQRNFSFLERDLLSGDCSELLSGVDVLFHLAGQPGVRSSWGGDFARYTDNNILATQALLEAARRNPVKKFVYASTSSVY